MKLVWTRDWLLSMKSCMACISTLIFPSVFSLGELWSSCSLCCSGFLCGRYCKHDVKSLNRRAVASPKKVENPKYILEECMDALMWLLDFSEHIVTLEKIRSMYNAFSKSILNLLYCSKLHQLIVGKSCTSLC